jgi:hypothetical protein
MKNKSNDEKELRECTNELLESIMSLGDMYYYLDKNNNAFPCRSPKEIKDTLYYYYEAPGGRLKKHIGKSRFIYKNEELFISTIFLVCDHNYYIFPDGEKRPILFETMLFHKDKSIDNWMMRYCTYDEALKSHDRIVKIFEYLEKRYLRKIKNEFKK